MTRVNYYIPIEDNPSRVGSFFNEFLYYGGRRYQLIKKTPQNLELKEVKVPQTLGKIIFKVILLLTVILPLIATIYRFTQIIKWSSYKQVMIISSRGESSSDATEASQKKEQLPQPKIDLDERVVLLNENKKDVKGLQMGEDELEAFFLKSGAQITVLRLEDFNQENALKYLGYCPNVQRLFIDGSRINHEGIRRLSNLPLECLQALSIRRRGRNSFSDAHLTAEDIRVLAESKTLKNVICLELGGAFLGTEGAKYLAESKCFKNITTLILDACMIDDNGIEYLCHSENLKNLTYLDLSHNHIGTRGARFIANSENLNNLSTLCLSANHIRVEGARALSVSTNKLESLDILFNEIPISKHSEVRALFRNTIKLTIL